MPYAFFRDTVNAANPNKHAGNIYSTQLCVEICQNTSTSKFVEEVIEDGKIVIKYEPGDSVVCNLASINVAKVNTDDEIKKVIPVAMRLLDNVIDLNFYPIKEAEATAKKYRSV
jgi:ribonucleoside-diphosphate reductase alpha chain